MKNFIYKLKNNWYGFNDGIHAAQITTIDFNNWVDTNSEEIIRIIKPLAYKHLGLNIVKDNIEIKVNKTGGITYKEKSYRVAEFVKCDSKIKSVINSFFNLGVDDIEDSYYINIFTNTLMKSVGANYKYTYITLLTHCIVHELTHHRQNLTDKLNSNHYIEQAKYTAVADIVSYNKMDIEVEANSEAELFIKENISLLYNLFKKMK